MDGSLHFLPSIYNRLNLSDEAIEEFTRQGTTGWRGFGWGAMAVLGSPVAVYGFLHRLVPAAIVRWSVSRFGSVEQMKARVSTTAILSGVASFGLFYGVLIGICRSMFDWTVAIGYGLSLPVSGLLGHAYFCEGRRLMAGLGNSMRLVRLRLGSRRLLKLRDSLICEIEAVRSDYGRTLQSPNAEVGYNKNRCRNRWNFR